MKLFEKKGVAVCPLPERAGLVSWPHLMALLGEMELTSLLIEGGGRVNGSALRAGVVDKIVWFLAPRLIGGEGAHGVLGGAGIRSLRDAVPVKRLTVTPVGPDWMMEGYL